jgi:hypothetical protein
MKAVVMGADTIWSVRNVQLGKLEEWIAKNSTWLAIGVIAAAFALRLAYASSCYLNPDEALHFEAAQPNSWLGAYDASRMLAHPPLFILVLHWFLLLGHSEVVLRMPSIIGGTVALWFAFAWIRRVLGRIPALAGMLFMALSQAELSASTEVRQYGLLLCFVCGALYATERALAERSTGWAIVQGLFLLFALLTHYTALIVIGSLDLYVLLRLFSDRAPLRLFFTIGVTQAVLALAFGWLYFEQIRRSAVFHPATLSYLTPYFFVRGSETPIGFVTRSLLGTFAYIVNWRLALPSMLVLLAGLVALLTGRTSAERLTSLWIVAPLVFGFVAAIYRVFPFAGSRHQTYLLPFLAMGFSAALAWIPARLAAPLLLAPLILAPIWVTHNPPANNPKLFPIGEMTKAILYIDQTVPPGAPLFVDGQTGHILAYYLGRDDFSSNSSLPNRNNGERPGGHRVIAPRDFVRFRSFEPNEVFAQVNESARGVGVPSGDPLWIITVAWPEREPLGSRMPPRGLGVNKTFATISVIEATRN